MGFICLKATEPLIKLGQQVNLIESVALGTPPRKVVTLLLHNVTLANLFVSSYRGATVMKFGPQNRSLIKQVHKALLH